MDAHRGLGTGASIALQELHLAVFPADVDVIARPQPEVLDVPHRRLNVHACGRLVGPPWGGLPFASFVLHQPRRARRQEVAVLPVAVVIHQRPCRPAPTSGLQWEARHFTAFDVNEVKGFFRAEHGLAFPIGVDVDVFHPAQRHVRLDRPNLVAVHVQRRHLPLGMDHVHVLLGPVVAHRPERSWHACGHVGLPWTSATTPRQQDPSRASRGDHNPARGDELNAHVAPSNCAWPPALDLVHVQEGFPFTTMPSSIHSTSQPCAMVSLSTSFCQTNGSSNV